MTRLRIGQKVLLTMLAVVIPSLLLLSFLILSSTGDILRANATRKVKELAAKSAQSLEELVHDSETALLTIASSPVVAEFLAALETGDPDEVRRRLSVLERSFLDLQRLDKTIQAIRFIDPQGYVLAKVREGAVIPRREDLQVPGLGIGAVSSKRRRDFFQAAIKLGPGEVSVSNLERGWMEGEDAWCPEMVRFSTPVFFADGRLAGVITINVWGEAAGLTINRLIAPEAGSAFLIERNLQDPQRNGIYLFHQDSTCEFGNQTGSRITVFQHYPEFITAAWMGSDQGVTIHPQSKDIIAHQFISPYHRQDKGWVVVVNARRDFFMAPLATIRQRILWFSALVLALVVVAAWFFARSLTRPIQDVIDGTHRIGKDLRHRIPVRSADELGALAREINRMAASLEEHLAEKKRIAERICQSEKLASIGEMAAGLAHELNTPLNNARVLSALAKKDLERGRVDPEAIKEDLDDILRQTDRCTRIIAGLLSFARRQEPDRSPQDINRLLQECIDLVRIRSAKRAVSVVLEAEDELPQLAVDGHQMQQVFVNLMLNAIDAMEEGGRLTVSTALRRDEVHIRFADTGSGIAPEHLGKIFDPFFTTKDVGKGTGLGLAVSYGIVRRHGGGIDVASTLGTGSVFTVTLPVDGGEHGTDHRG